MVDRRCFGLGPNFLFILRNELLYSFCLLNVLFYWKFIISLVGMRITVQKNYWCMISQQFCARMKWERQFTFSYAGILFVFKSFRAFTGGVHLIFRLLLSVFSLIRKLCICGVFFLFSWVMKAEQNTHSLLHACSGVGANIIYCDII